MGSTVDWFFYVLSKGINQSIRGQNEHSQIANLKSSGLPAFVKMEGITVLRILGNQFMKLNQAILI